MTDFTPTEEQLLILAEAKSTQSLLMEADAGAAKTTTLCLLAKKLPLVPTLCCAFNKSISIEMAKRMPSHIQCSTMNSLGHRAWANKTGKRLRVEADKVYTLVQELYRGITDRSEKRDFGEAMSDTLRTLRMAKSAGYIPNSMLQLGQPLLTWEELAEGIGPQIDTEPDEWLQDIVDKILTLSITQAYEGLIDYDDQIYMSCLFQAKFPTFPIVMVDEAQDLSPMNHLMIRKMASGRLIAVGDPKQAIYGFRGAQANSMNLLAEEFQMKRMYLHVSFRCPRAVVERARWRAPDMQYPSWAKQGLVSRLPEWDASHFQDGSAVICRNNAPLFALALRLIRAGRGIKLVGNDIGANLLKVLAKLGPETMLAADALQAIADWEEAQLTKARESRRAAIHDRAECLRVFCEFGKTLGEAIAYAKHLFESSGPIQLMSGHKSKGLEFETVYILDDFLVPSKYSVRLAAEGYPEQLEQEKNLKYVMQTRSMENLYFIDSEDMV